MRSSTHKLNETNVLNLTIKNAKSNEWLEEQIKADIRCGYIPRSGAPSTLEQRKSSVHAERPRWQIWDTAGDCGGESTHTNDRHGRSKSDVSIFTEGQDHEAVTRIVYTGPAHNTRNDVTPGTMRSPWHM